MHFLCTRIYGPVGLQIVMQRTRCPPPVDELDTADLDHEMTELQFQPGGLGIQYDLTHPAISL